MLEATSKAGMVVEAMAVKLMMMLLRGRTTSCCPYMLCCARRGQSTSTAYVPAHPG